MSWRGTVQELYHYPVKSLRGERCETLELTPRGARHDRRHALVDRHGYIASGKDTRRFRAKSNLLDLQAVVVDDAVWLRLGDGELVACADGSADEWLSRHLGEPMRIEREAQVSHFDVGAVHIITTAAMQWLRRRLPGAIVDGRRFRPNMVIDCPPAPGIPEHDWPGRAARIGSCLLDITGCTERCVMTTLAQDELPAEPAILKTLHTHGDLLFGVYAEVRRPGTVRQGDVVSLE